MIHCLLLRKVCALIVAENANGKLRSFAGANDILSLVFVLLWFRFVFIHFTSFSVYQPEYRLC